LADETKNALQIAAAMNAQIKVDFIKQLKAYSQLGDGSRYVS
jgi:hypothetical protein